MPFSDGIPIEMARASGSATPRQIMNPVFVNEHRASKMPTCNQSPIICQRALKVTKVCVCVRERERNFNKNEIFSFSLTLFLDILGVFMEILILFIYF